MCSEGASSVKKNKKIYEHMKIFLCIFMYLFSPESHKHEVIIDNNCNKLKSDKPVRKVMRYRKDI